MTVPPRLWAYFIAQFLTCAYALWRGGAPERLTAILMAAAGASTAAIPFDPLHSFFTVSWRTLGIDLVMFAALLALVARANRYWPIWIAAMQLLAIGIHVVRGVDPLILPQVYNRAVGELSYPMMIFLIIGTMRHRHRARTDRDIDWSKSRW